MTSGEQVELTLLPSQSKAPARIDGVTGRILRVRTELPINTGTLLKTCWNGNVILGEVMKRETDAMLVNIRHWLTAADLYHMSRNWIIADRKSVK